MPAETTRALLARAEALLRRWQKNNGGIYVTHELDVDTGALLDDLAVMPVERSAPPSALAAEMLAIAQEPSLQQIAGPVEEPSLEERVETLEAQERGTLNRWRSQEGIDVKLRERLELLEDVSRVARVRLDALERYPADHERLVNVEDVAGALRAKLDANGGEHVAIMAAVQDVSRRAARALLEILEDQAETWALRLREAVPEGEGHDRPAL